jgi:hypothetical protein
MHQGKQLMSWHGDGASRAGGANAEEEVALAAVALSTVMGMPDLLALVTCALDLPSTLALATASRALHASLMSDIALWRPHAATMGVVSYPAVEAAAVEAESRGDSLLGWRPARTLLVALRDASRLRCGDCLEVMDPFHLWAVARVLCVVRCRLLLVHFEGYSTSWCMWLDRARDAKRIRPLSRACPSGAGASPREPHDERSFHRVLTAARGRLLQGDRTEWALDGPSVGHGSWPAAYTGADESTLAHATGSASDVSVARFELTLDDAERRALLDAPMRPFRSAREYSKDRERCRDVHRAATTWGFVV